MTHKKCICSRMGLYGICLEICFFLERHGKICITNYDEGLIFFCCMCVPNNCYNAQCTLFFLKANNI